MKSVVHRNLKHFAKPVQVVRRLGMADLRPLSQAIMKTFNRIVQNLSETHKDLVIVCGCFLASQN